MFRVVVTRQRLAGMEMVVGAAGGNGGDGDGGNGGGSCDHTFYDCLRSRVMVTRQRLVGMEMVVPTMGRQWCCVS